MSDALMEISAKVSPVSFQTPSVIVKIFPDSGANICLAGPKHLQQMGIKYSQLQQCNKKVKTVGGLELICRGWLPIKFEIEGHTTTQPVYFCEKVDRLYFSKQGCIAVNILSSDYPYPMHSLKAHAKSIEEITFRQPPPQRPISIPFPALPENIGKLEQYIRDRFADSVFNNSAPFPALSGPPAKIHIKPDAIPFAARHTPVPVPHHWKAAVKNSLDKDVERGIIAPVPIGTPVTWCSPMVVVSKSDGTPRRTIDFQKLNAQCLRETHHTSSPFQLATQVPAQTKKYVLDAVDGFHSVQLDKESQPLTTFITEWGRYVYLRMPQGFLAAGDAYTRRYDEIIADVARKVKIVDDTLLYDDTIEQHFYHVWDYLTLCAKNGVVINKKKFQFCKDTIDFAGLTITPTGIEPSEKMLSSISGFPTPTDLTSACSWFGLVNQVAWAYSLSPIMLPFRDLIRPHQRFYWDENLDNLFEASKKTIVDQVKQGVQSFDFSRQTRIQPDWSKEGIGYLLLQKQCECSEKSPLCCHDGWKLIFAGSRFTKKAERNYSPTEGEALALSYSLHHSRLFTLGCPDLFVATDHKPLLGIFNNRDLGSKDNPRILSLKESVLPWHFDIMHCPGKWTQGPDALSRHPGKISAHLSVIREESSESDDSIYLSAENASEVSSIIVTNELGSITLDHINNAAHSDPQYQDLLKRIESGFPDKRNQTEPSHLREFWEVRHRLSIYNGIALLDKRIIIPRALRRVVLDKLHSANQGVTGMRF